MDAATLDLYLNVLLMAGFVYYNLLMNRILRALQKGLNLQVSNAWRRWRGRPQLDESESVVRVLGPEDYEP